MQSPTAVRHLRDAPSAPIVRSPCEAPAPGGAASSQGPAAAHEPAISADLGAPCHMAWRLSLRLPPPSLCASKQASQPVLKRLNPAGAVA